MVVGNRHESFIHSVFCNVFINTFSFGLFLANNFFSYWHVEEFNVFSLFQMTERGEIS